MVEKVTKMLVKVDLQCWRCRKKIKKILCRIPQIRDQIYDEKQNAVEVTVVCCSPEKIRDKIICKGGETVLGVKILPEKKPVEPEKKPEKKPVEPEKPKEPEKKRPNNDDQTDSGSDKPGSDKTDEAKKEPAKPKVVIVEAPKEPRKPAPAPAPAPPAAPAPAPPPKAPEPALLKPPEPAPAPPPPKAPEPVVGYLPMPMPMYPMVRVCCCPCCEGNRGGPCYYHGQGRPMMCHDGCGRQAYECQGGSRGYYVSRCDYFSEESTAGCTVM